MKRAAGFLSVLTAAALAAGAATADDGIAESYNETGRALFRELAGPDGNVVMSPYSIGTAMAMATAGARGATLQEMTAGLGLPDRPGDLAEAAGTLRRAIGEGSATVSLANALHMTKHGELVAGSYRTLLAQAFGAEVFEGSDLEAVNAWVSDKTRGRIPKILDRLDPLSVAVILNAVHFEAKWDRQFEPGATAPGPFRLIGGETVEVETMRQTGMFRTVQMAGLSAITLPYVGGRLEMIVTLPADPDTAPVPPGAATFAELRAALEAAEPARLDLTLPKVEIRFEAGLIAPFRAMGIMRPFVPGAADFGGVTGAGEGEDRIYITQVQHKGFISVAEDGTEAAAATGVEMSVTAAPPPAEAFRVDRPFAFAILDKPTGAILFLGRVTDPR